MTITEKNIQTQLFYYCKAKGYKKMMPNFTPENWWECDLLGITESNYMVEFEIKLTKSDFNKDKKKERIIRNIKEKTHTTINKHELLTEKTEYGPSRFYYVAPQGVITTDMLPKFAGLIEIFVKGNRLYTKQIKPAPRLHNNQIQKK